MKRLFLLRHAEAEQGGKDSPADAERALTERGRADAGRIGRRMREKGYRPDRILCSPSRRTRETLEIAQAQFGGCAGTEFLDSLYAGGGLQILALLRSLPEDIQRPLAVGHNPGFENCILLLAGGAGDSAVRSRFDAAGEKFPAAALAVVDFDLPDWKSIAPGAGVLAEVIRPRNVPKR